MTDKMLYTKEQVKDMIIAALEEANFHIKVTGFCGDGDNIESYIDIDFNVIAESTIYEYVPKVK